MTTPADAYRQSVHWYLLMVNYSKVRLGLKRQMRQYIYQKRRLIFVLDYLHC